MIRTNRRKYNEWITAYLFLLPDVAGLTLFVFVPILYALYISLFDWNLLSPKVFIGFDNYAQMFKDNQWWKSLEITFIYAIIYVPLLFISSLFFAVLLSNFKGKFMNTVRTLYLMPFAITSVISAVIWIFLLDPRSGFVNKALALVGIPHQPFLGSITQALPTIILVLIWINLGYNMTIFLASIKDIPADYYEAARMDGANRWDAFRYITFPLLRGISVFILVVSTIGSFQVFDQIKVMTGGGPANATEVSVLYLYKQGFQLLNMGYTSALATMLFLIIFILSIAQLKIFSNKE
ncbi:carbohydrate ABC transporter permease [Paenibacillus psychroresistens]|uniref:carbohydrate ABC transporter permease n=1 Tax=Paenibacillus psychroresistens TaxID=1778678 RepID=UPI001878A945|nr:sugar ABC transporter permease [Paenibacillus psychroresistens]